MPSCTDIHTTNTIEKTCISVVVAPLSLKWVVPFKLCMSSYQYIPLSQQRWPEFAEGLQDWRTPEWAPHSSAHILPYFCAPWDSIASDSSSCHWHSSSTQPYTGMTCCSQFKNFLHIVSRFGHNSFSWKCKDTNWKWSENWKEKSYKKMP